MLHTVEIDLGGRKITLETGKMAKQANGAVVVRSGDRWCWSPPARRTAQSRAQLFPAHRGLPRVHVRRRQDFPAASSSAKAARPKKKFSPAG